MYFNYAWIISQFIILQILQIISSIEVYLQIVAENLNKDVITVVGVTSEIKEGSVFNIINNVVNDIAGVKINYKQITREKALRNYNFSSADLVLVQNLSNDINVTKCHNSIFS